MKPRATASALLFFVLLATLTILVVIDFPGVASVQPMFRGGNEEAAAAALALATTPSSSSISSSHDLVNPTTTNAPADEDEECRICLEPITDMEEDHLVRCTSKQRHPHCMRCYAKNHLIYKFNPTKCLGCNIENTIDPTVWTVGQKAFHAGCQAEFGVGGEGGAEAAERARREEEEERRANEEATRAYEQSLTPIMRALYREDVDETQSLIRQGEVENVNAKDSDGFSILMEFLLNGSSEKVQHLLNYAVQTRQIIDVNYVLPDNGEFGRPSTLMLAINSAIEEESIKQLMDYSIRTEQIMDVNFVNQQNGLSTLMYTIYAETSQRVQQLFEYSRQTNQHLDVNCKNELGETALMLAIRKENPDVVRELLKLPGINLNQKNNDGETAEQIALKSSNQEIGELVNAAIWRGEHDLLDYTRC